MALRDIAQAAAMPPSKTHLYLASFLRENLVTQHAGTGRYALGAFAIELGLSAMRQLSIADLSRPKMSDLTGRSGCATYLSLFTPRGPAILSKVDGLRQGAFTVRLGYVLPMTNSATGLVFLAFLPQTETEKALQADRAESKDKKNRPSLLRRLAAIRQNGYATTTGMVNANFAAISAPIFDHGDNIAAALTILGPDKYLVGDRMDRTIKDLLKATAQISAKLGHKAR